MSGYDITADMSDWDYALYNTQRDRKRRVDALVKKYGFPIREQDLLEEDYVEYDLLKNDLQSMEKEEPVNYALLRNLSPEDEDTNDYASTSNAGNNSAKNILYRNARILLATKLQRLSRHPIPQEKPF